MNKYFIVEEVRIFFQDIPHFLRCLRALPNVLKNGREFSKIGENLQYKQTIHYRKIHTHHEWVIPNLHFCNIWWNAIKPVENLPMTYILTPDSSLVLVKTRINTATNVGLFLLFLVLNVSST